MRNDGKSEMQHFVPKNALLKNFSFRRPGKKSHHVHLFDRLKGRAIPSQPSVNNVLGQRNFYSVEVGEHVISAERSLTALEDVASPIIGRVISDGSLASVSSQDRANLSTFIAAQWLRSPKIRESQKALWKKIAKKCERIAPEAENLGEIQAYASDIATKYSSIKMLEDATNELAKMVFSYPWLLFRATPEQSFWISDCPVVMHNQEELGAYGSLGFGVPGVQISMPLSSEFALTIWHPKIVRDKSIELEEGQKIIKQVTATRTLSPNTNLQNFDQMMRKTESTLGNIRALLDSLDNGSAIQTSSDNMEHYNSLQFDWSQRFIVSKRNDFLLAERMFSNEPERGVNFRID